MGIDPFGRLAARTEPLRGGGRGWVLLTVAAGWFVTLGLRFVVPALLPYIKDTFTVGNAAAGLAVTVIWVTYAGMQLPAGVLSDSLGERRLLTASLFLAGGSLLLFSVFPVFALFLLAAGLFGLGTGLYGPARGLVLSRTFRDNDGTAFGLTLAAGSIGSAVLPFVATQVTEAAGWEIALAAFAPLFFVLGAGVWWAVPPKSAVETVTARSTGEAREEETDGGADHERTLSAVVGAATRRRVVVATLGATFMLFTLQGLTAFYTTYLVETKAFAETTAASLFALLFLVGAGFQFFSGRATDRYGHRRVLVALALLGIPPLVAFPLVEGRLAITALTAVLAVRIGVSPVVNAYVVSVIPAHVRGTTWGVVRTVFFGIGATGSLAVGFVADAGLFDVAMYGLAALTLPAVFIFAVLPDRAGQPK